MTTPTAPLDPRTAKDLARKIVDDEMCGHTDEDSAALAELHARCFAALGTTRLEIAATLHELECFGRPADQVTDGGTTYGDLVDGEDNPLAVYFRDVCGALHASFDTLGGQIYWSGTLPASSMGHEGVTLPSAVADFQDSYQNFEYPELHRDGSTALHRPQVVDRTPISPEQADRDLDAAIADRAARLAREHDELEKAGKLIGQVQ